MNFSADNNDKQEFFKKCHEQLDKWCKFTELRAKDIEKFTKKYLGVQKEGFGSKNRKLYSHYLLRNHIDYGPEGIFGAHPKHGTAKNNPKFKKYDYKVFIYPALKEILRLLEEANNE